MKRITYDWLRRQGACEEQRDLAALHFGRSARLTWQMLLECVELGLDVEWLSARFFGASNYITYARQVYLKHHREIREIQLLWDQKQEFYLRGCTRHWKKIDGINKKLKRKQEQLNKLRMKEYAQLLADHLKLPPL